MINWIIKNFFCRYFGHSDGERVPLFIPWYGKYDNDPYWNSIKSQEVGTIHCKSCKSLIGTYGDNV